MAQLLIKAGRPSEVTSAERRHDLEALRAQLAVGGADVDLEIAEYVPGQRGLTWGETVSLFVVASVGGAILVNITNDVYSQTKSWALARFRRKHAANPSGKSRPESFIIYGPDGQVLKRWRVDEEGEHEDD